jgi:hypothetical protein
MRSAMAGRVADPGMVLAIRFERHWVAGPDLSSRGATHASHGSDREGQPRTVSKRSLRKWMLAMPLG